jgi:hypothetical protein
MTRLPKPRRSNIPSVEKWNDPVIDGIVAHYFKVLDRLAMILWASLTFSDLL